MMVVDITAAFIIVYQSMKVSISISLDVGVEASQLDGSFGILREKLFAVAGIRRVEIHHSELCLDEVVDSIFGQHAHRRIVRLRPRR